MKHSKEDLDKMIQNQENYKFLGQIYYNKHDSRLIVPKKFKWLGWTLNFANKLAYLLLILTGISIYLLYKF